MALSQQTIDEINLLLQFDPSNIQAGIKVHSSASPEYIAAAERLFERGLIDHIDGGYLTQLGRECVTHLQGFKQILYSSVHS